MAAPADGGVGICQIRDNTATDYGGGVYLKSGSLIVNAGAVSAYGKRRITYTDTSGNYVYWGNRAGENGGTDSESSYSSCGNSWFSESGSVRRSGEVLTGTEITVGGTDCRYSDDDLVAGVSGWSGIVE